MNTVVGVFTSRVVAERAARKLPSAGLSREEILLLEPENRRHAPVLTSDTEQPGMGAAMGTFVGSVIGVAGGLPLGTIVITTALPGVGPVMATGLMGAAVLGVAGAGFGAAAGRAFENALTEGIPADELFVYEDALRKGRTVLFAFAGDDDTADSARRAMEEEGAESVDAARKQWWIGLRSAEQEHYLQLGGDFEQDEKFYRMGFEAALNARTRCQEYDQIMGELENHLEELRMRYPDDEVEEPFRHGYRRGREHYHSLCSRKSVMR
jgi:hypothetical protein